MNELKNLYKKQKDKIFNYLMRMTGDYDLATDLMQESFTRYLEHYGDKSQENSLIYTIARNAFLDTVRMRNRERWTTLKEEEQDQSSNQEKTFLIKEEYRQVLRAMQLLTDSERETLALVISGELSYKEIASITGLSVANIKVKVHRARHKLKKILRRGKE